MNITLEKVCQEVDSDEQGALERLDQELSFVRQIAR